MDLHNNPLHLIVVGDLLEDIFVKLNGPIRMGTDTYVRISRKRGGAAASTAIVAREQGALVRFIGCVGADTRGDCLVEELEKKGVVVLARRRGYTGSVVVLVHSDGERTMLTDRGAASQLIDPDLRWVDGMNILHLSLYAFENPHMAKAMYTLADRAHESHCYISIDVASSGLIDDLGEKQVSAILQRIDPQLILANSDECTPIVHLPFTLLVVKRGTDPTEIYHAGELVDKVALPRVLSCANSTGAGDAFAAGFLLAWGQGAPIRDATEAAHRIAAQYLTRLNKER